MLWLRSHRSDPPARALADRHYNRQKVGAPGFVPPGRCLVFLTPCQDALWVTSWPFAAYVKHAWAGAWMNSCFRNESPFLSSLLIRQAVAATRFLYGEPPDLGLVTFIDIRKVRKKRDWGRCYRKAGFFPARCPRHETRDLRCPACAGLTAGGLVALQLLPGAMPEPEPLYDPKAVPAFLISR